MFWAVLNSFDEDLNNIVKYLGFAWLIRRLWDLIIELWDLFTTGYSCSQITIWHTVIFYDWTHSASYHTSLFRCTLCRLLTVSSYNSSSRTQRKTQFYVYKNARLSVRYLAMDVLLLLSAYSSGICLPSRCLAMVLCVIISCTTFVTILRYIIWAADSVIKETTNKYNSKKFQPELIATYSYGGSN
jgi:hypothetical protein